MGINSFIIYSFSIYIIITSYREENKKKFITMKRILICGGDAMLSLTEALEREARYKAPEEILNFESKEVKQRIAIDGELNYKYLEPAFTRKQKKFKNHYNKR